MGLSLLAQASMPLKYWDEAFLSAVYLINRLPTKLLDFSTPLEILEKIKPDYASLRIFGCACYPNLHPFNARKLEYCSKQCAFLGYSNLHKGYKCLDISSGRIYISRDVIFDETIFPFAKLHDNAGICLISEILLLPPHLLNPGQFDHGGENNSDDPIVANTPLKPANLSREHAENQRENDASRSPALHVHGLGTGIQDRQQATNDESSRTEENASAGSSQSPTGKSGAATSPRQHVGARITTTHGSPTGSSAPASPDMHGHTGAAGSGAAPDSDPGADMHADASGADPGAATRTGASRSGPGLGSSMEQRSTVPPAQRVATRFQKGIIQPK